jgi:sugar phosphate isomerase/epimerase
VSELADVPAAALPLTEADIAEARSSAATVLNSIPIGGGPADDAQDHPIAASMLQFPPFAPDGRTVAEAGPEHWAAVFAEISHSGYEYVEVPSAWLPTGDLTSAQLGQLNAAAHEAGLRIVATAEVRRTVLDEQDGKAHIAAAHRAIDAAAALGAAVVCLGLQEPLTAEQQAVTWFWTRRNTHPRLDRDAHDQVVAAYQELGRHAGQIGVQISLELYEDTLLGSSAGAVSLIHDIGLPNVGLNPDIGNLIRQHDLAEPWEYIAVTTLPYANYWHVKNYLRIEDPAKSIYLSVPATLREGLINYRKAIRFARQHGFSGAFVVEHYGGDGLSIGAENKKYLEHLLSA